MINENYATGEFLQAENLLLIVHTWQIDKTSSFPDNIAQIDKYHVTIFYSKQTALVISILMCNIGNLCLFFSR